MAKFLNWHDAKFQTDTMAKFLNWHHAKFQTDTMAKFSNWRDGKIYETRYISHDLESCIVI